MAKSPKAGGGAARGKPKTFKAHNRSVEIHEDDKGIALLIDKQPVSIARMGPKEYHSILLPYAKFESAEELARALARDEGKLWKRTEKK